LLDQLFSDHEEGGGIYGGTANIVIGESGVGKSTVMLDILAKIKRNQPEAKVLYISSEMTRNDLFFYYRKMPIIAEVPTLLLMDYIQTGFVKAIEKALTGEHDVILIDSHQDIIVKLKDVLGWKSTYAEAWLTNLVIKAADGMGKSIFCIQHMTKGGTYVGSTYLKHATTSMMEIKFGPGNRRYLEFTKNRRGGSLVNKPLFYSMADGQVVYDQASWDQQVRAEEVAHTEEARREELESEFDSLFLSAQLGVEEVVTETPATKENKIEVEQ
jgi:predicted ATP-dependent serine protease